MVHVVYVEVLELCMEEMSMVHVKFMSCVSVEVIVVMWVGY